MRVIFRLNIVSKDYEILQHNVPDKSSGETISAYAKFGIPAVALPQRGRRHYSLGGAETCATCHNLIRDHLTRDADRQ